MEFKKSISWAGNVYEKFEAMCLEVEEVIYEDTVKYMENQVQKVGKTVKKFYCEMMQDFLPPSCMEPVRIALVDKSPDLYSHTDVNKKPKLCILELKKKDAASENNGDRISEEKYNQMLQSCRVLVESTGSGLCSAKSMTLGARKHPIGIKRISRTNHSPKTPGPTTCSSKGRSNLMVHDTRRDCTVTSYDMNATRLSEPSAKCDHEEAKPQSVSVSDATEKTFSLAAESRSQEKDNSELNPVNNVLPVESLRLDENNSVCSSSFHDKLTKDDSISDVHSRNMSTDQCEVESAGKEVIISHEEYFDMEVMGNKEVTESAEVEDYESIENSNLEDTCVFVESQMHNLVPQGSQQNKPYKKKFREALSSKLKPTRKQKQLNSPDKDLDAENNIDVVIPDPTMNSNSWYKPSPAQDSFGSDWELI